MATKKTTTKKTTTTKATSSSSDNGKSRYGTPMHLRGTIASGLAQLTRRHAKLASWQTDDKDHRDVLTAACEHLKAAIATYTDAVDCLAELPEDFRPKSRGYVPFQPGDVVVLKESKRKANRLALEDVTCELTVDKIDTESKRVLCITDNGERWFGPTADIARC